MDNVEALRKALCALPRYSFILNSSGGIRRVEDRYGRWIEWDEAHKFFDPVVLDSLGAQRGWESLTDEEINSITSQHWGQAFYAVQRNYARSIEAALRKKNNGKECDR